MTRKKAIAKLKKVEDALLTALSVIQGYVEDVRAVREWLESAGKK